MGRYFVESSCSARYGFPVTPLEILLHGMLFLRLAVFVIGADDAWRIPRLSVGVCEHFCFDGLDATFLAF